MQQCLSRKTYYQIKRAYDEGGSEALAGKSRKVPNVKNRVPGHIEQAVLKLSRETYPNRKRPSEQSSLGTPSLTKDHG